MRGGGGGEGPPPLCLVVSSSSTVTCSFRCTYIAVVVLVLN